MAATTTDRRGALDRERQKLAHHLAALLDGPMTLLAFVWLGLMILEFTRGLAGWLEVLNYVIWAAFGFQFLLEFTIAPSKRKYLRANWITAVALVLPAFRVLRAFRAFRGLRAARAARSAGLLRLLTSLNRGAGAVRRLLRRHGAGYVIALTVLVTFAGAAGMFLFERPESPGAPGLRSYGEAVWWTAMIIATMGSEYWPRTAEGRLLCWFLAVYAFAIFGYITATIASYFVGRERTTPSPAAGDLRGEIAGLKAQIEQLTAELRRAR